MTTQVALLRGINVGSHRRIPMGELREFLTGLGYGDVRTLLQSGNIVLTSDSPPKRLAGDLEREIADRFGVESEVVVRTQKELAAVLALDPLGDVADDDRRYQVSFLSAKPAPEAVEKIAAVDLGQERFVQVGREIYAWHPDGIHGSSLAKLLSDPRRLGVTVTARNWRTVGKLLELAGSNRGGPGDGR